ncbi:MAG: tRNA (adenosine(37)-N6)-dimethylallyltransferase [Thermoleophilia bacterium]
MLALLGPTAAGKSALAHAVARSLGGPVVVADPFQRYRGLEIAADGPRPAERAEVDYRCVGDLALSERSTAAAFAEAAHAAIDEAIDRGVVPVVSGGTGLYARAALADLAFPAEPDEAERAWAEELARDDPARAAADLARLDPAAARRIDPANPRRVARALALARAGGAAPGPAGLWSGERRRPTLVVALTRPREILDELIAARVRRELDDGLVAELEAALEAPDTSREALQVIGAREVAAVRAGALDPGELPERLAARTRRLARKQLTWLRKVPVDAAIDLGDRPAEDALGRLMALWREATDRPVSSGG